MSPLKVGPIEIQQTEFERRLVWGLLFATATGLCAALVYRAFKTS